MSLKDFDFSQTTKDLQNAFKQLDQAMMKLSPEQRSDMNNFKQKITKIGFDDELSLSEKLEKMQKLENEMKMKYGNHSSR